MKKYHVLYLMLVMSMVMVMSLTGCTVTTEGENEKIKDIEFTVLGEENIPEELQQIIEEKKEKEFKITYQDSDFLYICVGYGKQETGGYSITVNDLYLTANAIYVDTNLMGPEPESRDVYQAQEKEGASYPYVVVKIEYLDEAVVFD